MHRILPLAGKMGDKPVPVPYRTLVTKGTSPGQVLKSNHPLVYLEKCADPECGNKVCPTLCGKLVGEILLGNQSHFPRETASSIAIANQNGSTFTILGSAAESRAYPPHTFVENPFISGDISPSAPEIVDFIRD